MEQAVNGLEIEFKKITNNLQYAMHKLEAEFSDLEEEGHFGGVDVVSLVRRSGRLDADVKSMERRIAVIQQRRQQLLPALFAQLLENYNTLQQMCLRAQVVPSEDWPEAAENLSALAGTFARMQVASEDGDAVQMRQHVAELPLSMGEKTEITISSKNNDTLKPDNEMGSEKPAVAFTSLPKPQCTPVEITPEEFEAVPKSSRGRCKLEAVNQLMRTLVKMYQDAPRRGAVSTKELDARGVRATGLTGRQLLDTLRQLGRLEVKRDMVTLKQPSQYFPPRRKKKAS